MNKSVRYLIHLVFFYTCIEGVVFNILYPSLLPYVYKDIVILIVYFLVFRPNSSRLVPASPAIKKLAVPLLVFSVIMGIYLMLPGTDLFMGLVALKQRLFYIPLVSIAYSFVRSEEDLKYLFSMLGLYAIGAAIFGIYLYFTGPDGLRELGAHYFVEYRTPSYQLQGGEYWRVPGTFTSPGQYGAYLLFNGLVAMALLMTKSTPRLWKFIAAASLILIILAMLVSGSRTPFILLSASMGCLLLLSRKVPRVAAWGLVGYAVLAFGFSFLGPGVKDRFASIAAYEHVERFQTTYFGQLFLSDLVENPFGSGLGVATIGARHVSELKEVELVESYFGILAIETGVLGLCVFIWVVVTIGALIFRHRKQRQGSPTNVLWSTLAVYVLLAILILPVSTEIDHAPSNLYFWFSVGALIKLADLERRKRWVVQTAGLLQVAHQGIG